MTEQKKQNEEMVATIEIKNELCGNPCDLCKMYGKGCMPERMAKKLAKKGYRKQSATAEKIAKKC